MRLYAISDLHLHHSENRSALEAIPPHPQDWLILGGDLGEKAVHLHYCLQIVTRRFARVFWIPGNHELWTVPNDPEGLRGEAKYQQLVQICRSYGVLTPEDPFVLWPGGSKSLLIAPLFNLYDYSFRPDHVPQDQAIEWAMQAGILCNDESLLHPDPYGSIAEWCRQRLRFSEMRLEQALQDHPEASFILINHYPLRYEHVRLRRIPRFSLWCGTRATEEWHRRFPTEVVVYGHLHVRSTDYRDGVRFEEVSLGYPRQWGGKKPLTDYLQLIL